MSSSNVNGVYKVLKFSTSLGIATMRIDMHIDKLKQKKMLIFPIPKSEIINFAHSATINEATQLITLKYPGLFSIFDA